MGVSTRTSNGEVFVCIDDYSARKQVPNTSDLEVIRAMNTDEKTVENDPFWVDFHGQNQCENWYRPRAGMGKIPENTSEREAWLSKLRDNDRLRSEDERKHIEEQNERRKRFSKSEGKWKETITQTVLDEIWHGREKATCKVLRSRSFF